MSIRLAPRRAFTLMELLIVIAIIGLLVAILLPALGAVRRNARKVATQSQLESIAKANESYNLAFGSYAGFLSEPNLSARKQAFSSTENLMVSLMGRVSNVDKNKDGSARELIYDKPGNITVEMYFDNDNEGSGPQVVNQNGAGGQVYGPFYPPKAEELAKIRGEEGNASGNNISELVDASYGMPILYFRGSGGGTQPVVQSAGGTTKGTFQLDAAHNYVEATALNNKAFGQATYDQKANSLLSSTATKALENLAWRVINPKLSDTALNSPNDANDVPAGGFVLMATGFDQIYLNREQIDPNANIEDAKDLAKFDDIIVTGGTAP